MRLRALVIGLLGVIFIAGFGFINNHILQLERIAAGHLIPICVMGILLFLIAVNALFYRFSRCSLLRPSELAIAALMMFIACSIPGRGLMEQFTSALAMPMHHHRLRPEFQRHRLLDYVPEGMFPAGKDPDSPVIKDFVLGKGSPDKWISLGDVPWEGWWAPLSTWIPILLLTTAAVLSLSLILNRQWADHEQLPYPIADFTADLIQQEEGVGRHPLFGSRLFWIGLAAVAVIRIWNGLNVWFPGELVPIPMHYDLGPLTTLWPGIKAAPFARLLFRPNLFPIVVGFSFLLATEISFSIGISHFLFVPIAAVLVSYGVQMKSSYMAGGPMGWHRAGAYVAFGFTMFYIGRHYYTQVVRRALCLQATDAVPKHITWACRVFLACLVSLTGIFIAIGLDWTLAILTVGLIMLVFTGISRISAETGIFFIQARWQPLGVLIGLFGAHALGIEALIIVGLLCAVICLDPSQAVMPYFVNALRVCDRVKVTPACAARTAFLTYVVGLGVAIPVVLWAQYNYSAPTDGWSFSRVPTMTFRPAAEAADKLSAQGTKEASAALSPVERIMNIRPDNVFLCGAGTGFCMVLLFSFLRIRFPWWPLHPLIFLFWSTSQIAIFHHSFLLGWFIKRSVMKYGGQRAYTKTKPLMAGLIAGELVGAALFMIAGGLYYALSDQAPPIYRVFPR